MEVLNRMRDYLIPETFEIHYVQGQIHIMNFTSIGEIGSEKMIIRSRDGMVIIKGKKLTLAKLLQDEVLVKGIITAIEFR